jgi:hypothetical protein
MVRPPAFLCELSKLAILYPKI